MGESKHRICQFPDGNGGFIPHIMDDKGEWHHCDNDGNIIEEPNPEEEASTSSKKKESKPRKKSKKEQSESSALRKTSIYLPESLSRELRHYCVDADMSMAAVIIDAITAFLSKKKRAIAANKEIPE